MEPRRCSIKSYLLASECLIVWSSSLFSPLWTFVQVRHNTTRSNPRALVADVHSWFRVSWRTSLANVLPNFSAFNNMDVRIEGVNLHEPVSCWLEKCTHGLRPLISHGRAQSPSHYAWTFLTHSSVIVFNRWCWFYLLFWLWLREPILITSKCS